MPKSHQENGWGLRKEILRDVENTLKAKWMVTGTWDKFKDIYIIKSILRTLYLGAITSKTKVTTTAPYLIMMPATTN